MKYIAERMPRRTVQIDTPVGNMIYDDATQKYSRIIPQLARSVSSIESLVGYVKRYSDPGAVAGASVALLTVHITSAGGTFFLDDNIRQDIVHYQRQLSTPWCFVRDMLGTEYEHKEFVAALATLRPFIKEYDAVRGAFRSLRFDKNTTVESSPILTNGTIGSSRKMEFRVQSKDGEQTAAIPESIVVKIPFVKGSTEPLYELTLDLDVDPDSARFSVTCPEFEVITEAAILAEYDKFKAQTSGIANLLVVVQY